jgi:hypothetical protein
MEGPLLFVKAWMLSVVAVWVYRYFERVADPIPEFEAFCAAQPLLLAITCEAGALDELYARVAGRLGQRVVATSAGWPWQNYALTLAAERVGAEMLVVRAVRAELTYAHRAPPPALAHVLREALSGSEARLRDTWAHPALYFDVLRRNAAGGWRVVGLEAPKLRFEPRPDVPVWLPEPIALAPEAA